MTATAYDAAPPGAEPVPMAVVCDEQLLFADAFAEALRRRGVRAVPTADPARTAQIAIRDGAAIVVVNPEPWFGEAVAALRLIRRARPEIRLICVCSDDGEPLWRGLTQYVDLVVSKRRPLRELVDVVVGGAPRAATEPPITGRPRRGEQAPPLAAQFLNQRELQVLRLLATAETTRGIARRLGISVPTARGYIQSLFTKLGVHSRVEALSYAVQHSLVQL